MASWRGVDSVDLQSPRGLWIPELRHGRDLRQLHHLRSYRRYNNAEHPHRAKAASRPQRGTETAASLCRREQAATGVHGDPPHRLHHVQFQLNTVLTRSSGKIVVLVILFLYFAVTSSRCTFGNSVLISLCSLFPDVLLVVPTRLHHVHCAQCSILHRLVFQLRQVPPAYIQRRRRDENVPAAGWSNWVGQNARLGVRHENHLLRQLLCQLLHLQSLGRLLQTLPQTVV